MAVQDSIRVVLDTGSQCTKAGFSGEPSPRAVFPTTVARFRRPGLIDGFPLIFCGKEAVQKRGLCNLTWPVQEGLIKNWEEIEKLWHHIFYKELHVPPEEASVTYGVHPHVPRRYKERMTEILFESFTVNSLYLAMSPALVVHASGRTSGVAWENSYSCSYAVPIFEGFPLFHAMVCSPITGRMLTERLQKLLADIGYSFTTPQEWDILEKIKAELCYVANDYEVELGLPASAGDTNVCYTLPDGQNILLGEQRFKCPEILFQPSLAGLQCANTTDVICSSIEKCDLDYVGLMYDNVVVSGGSSMLTGLVKRLKAELTLKSLKTGFKTNVDELPMRQFATWAGASMVSSLSTIKDFYMTRTEYEEHGSDRAKYKFF